MRCLRLPNTWILHGLLIMSLCLSGVAGCEKDELRDFERLEISNVLKTGVGFKGDEYVRAETFRVLEIIKDPSFDDFALKGLEDPSEMVRLAALRALLATGNEKAERLGLADYSRATPLARRAMTEAAIKYGPEKFRQELFTRGLRSKDPAMRRFSFDQGVLLTVDRLVKEKKKSELDAQWIPKLSTFVDHKDSFIASHALRKLKALGREDRAEPLLAKFQSKETPTKDRVRLAKILGLAGVAQAQPLFLAILKKLADIEARSAKKLKLPQDKPEPALVRAATLGAVALGNETLIPAAQAYLDQASVEDSIEVMEHLAQNPSPEALVTLKVAMTDARPEVRRTAADLYSLRPQAKAKDLISALSQPDPVLRRKLANTLVARFPAKWGMNLRMQLRAEDRKDPTLSLLRQVIDRENDREVLDSIREQLLALASETDKGNRAAMASYLLLLIVSDDPEYKKTLAQSKDVRTRYVFLEHLLKNHPETSTEVFRRYFFDDLYTIRLMSAAGLWQAYKKKRDAAKAEGAT